MISDGLRKWWAAWPSPAAGPELLAWLNAAPVGAAVYVHVYDDLSPAVRREDGWQKTNWSRPPYAPQSAEWLVAYYGVHAHAIRPMIFQGELRELLGAIPEEVPA